MKTKSMWVGLLAGLVLGLIPLASAMAGTVWINNYSTKTIVVRTSIPTGSQELTVGQNQEVTEERFHNKAIISINVFRHTGTKPALAPLKGFQPSQPKVGNNYMVDVGGEAANGADVTIAESSDGNTFF